LSNNLSGLDGNDDLFGRGGTDLLSGGLGDDDLYGGADTDNLDGGGDQDKLYGEAAHDHLTGGTGADILFGGTGNDILLGDRTWVSNSDGNDALIGYGGGAGYEIDTMKGGGGADRFVLGTHAQGVFYKDGGHAVVEDFNRTQGDKLVVTGDITKYSFAQSSNNYSGVPNQTIVRYDGETIAIVQGITDINTQDLAFSTATNPYASPLVANPFPPSGGMSFG
jgi:Ca2+-binding RTX toxin-like protein